MSEEQVKEQAVSPEAKTQEKQEGADPKKVETKTPARGRGGARRTFNKRNVRKGSRFGSRPKPEFEQKIINISRVTRVVKGGRRLSFRVDMIIGDGKGRVGLGTGKATDTSLAIQKAFAQARKNLLYLKLTDTKSIPYSVEAKVTSSRVEMFPNKGRGLVAGSTVRKVLQIAGITDVTAKIQSRSKNKLNNAKVAIEGLKSFQMSEEEKKKLQEKIYAARQKESRGMRRPNSRYKSNTSRKPINRSNRAPQRSSK